MVLQWGLQQQGLSQRCLSALSTMVPCERETTAAFVLVKESRRAPRGLQMGSGSLAAGPCQWLGERWASKCTAVPAVRKGAEKPEVPRGLLRKKKQFLAAGTSKLGQPSKALGMGSIRLTPRGEGHSATSASESGARGARLPTACAGLTTPPPFE